ncbi:MAG: hypothetical protein Q9160_003932 [Pyrenula sp. 1 TL-2023]
MPYNLRSSRESTSPQVGGRSKSRSSHSRSYDLRSRHPSIASTAPPSLSKHQKRRRKSRPSPIETTPPGYRSTRTRSTSTNRSSAELIWSPPIGLMGYPSLARREIRRLCRKCSDGASGPHRHEVPVAVPLPDTNQDVSPRTALEPRRHSTRQRYQHPQEPRTRTPVDHAQRSPYTVDLTSLSPTAYTPRHHRRRTPGPRPRRRSPSLNPSSRIPTPADPSPARPPMDPQLGRWLNQMRADKAARRQERKEEKSRQRARERTEEAGRTHYNNPTTTAANNNADLKPAPFRPIPQPAPVMFPVGASAVPAGQAPYQAWVSEPITTTLKPEELEVELIDPPPQPGYAHVTQYARVPLRVPNHQYQQRAYHHPYQHAPPTQAQNPTRRPVTRHTSPPPAAFQPQQQHIPIPPLPSLFPPTPNLGLGLDPDPNIDPNLLNDPLALPPENLMSDADINTFLQSVGVDPTPTPVEQQQRAPSRPPTARTPRRSPRNTVTVTGTSRPSSSPRKSPAAAPPPHPLGLDLSSFDFLNNNNDDDDGAFLDAGAGPLDIDYDFAFDAGFDPNSGFGFGFDGAALPDLSVFGVGDPVDGLGMGLGTGLGESFPPSPFSHPPEWMFAAGGGIEHAQEMGFNGDAEVETEMDWEPIKVDFEEWLADTDVDDAGPETETDPVGVGGGGVLGEVGEGDGDGGDGDGEGDENEDEDEDGLDYLF